MSSTQGPRACSRSLRGIASYVTGEPLPEAPEEEHAGIESAHQELSRFRYCTGFVVEGEGLGADELERELASFGDSLLVVGDETAIKVHVHTDDPGRALRLATAMGVVEAVEVVNMHRQTVEREQRLLEGAAGETAATAVVAVSVGDGNRLLFESFGATVVDGGETMNPSTEALLRGDRGCAGGRGGRAAEQPQRVHGSRRGCGARDEAGSRRALGLDPGGPRGHGRARRRRSGEDDAAEMAEALDGIAVGAVTVASRAVNGVAESGDFLGLVDREPVVGGKELAEVAERVVETLLAEPRDVLTVLTGADEPELDGLLRTIESRWPDVELEVHAGGQPHYRLLLSAE